MRRPGSGRRRSPRHRSRCPARTARRAACGSAARCWQDRPGPPVPGGPGSGPPRRPSRWAARKSRSWGFLRCGVGDDPAVEYLDAAPGAGGDGVVVGDDDDRGAGGVELFQQCEDGRAGGGVEVAGGLVGQHYRRVASDGPGDRDPLAFPAGQLGGAGGGLVPEADPGQRGDGQPPPLVAADAGVKQPVGDVAQDGLVLGEEELLEHEPDPGSAQRRQLPVAQRRDVQAGDPYGAGCRLVQGAHQVQQRGLARPGRPGHRHQLAGGYRQAYLVKRPHGRLPRIHLRHVVQLQHPPPAGRRADAIPGHLRGGHDAATTTRSPGVSFPVTCTRPLASSNIPGVAGTQRRVFPGPTTSTWYPPDAWATSAVTGTASTGPPLLAVVMFTVTGAWSSVPSARGSVSVTCTGIVVVGPCPCWLDVVVATAPTEDTSPWVVVPSGSVTVTASPAFTSDGPETSSGIVTTRRFEVAANTGPDAGPPRLPVTWVTRSASGSNTTW